MASSFYDLKGQNSSRNSRIVLMWTYALTFRMTATENSLCLEWLSNY